ncbi:MAG: Asp-tRNA(Asn)/Glu-tRNA(Gln) amidotransferase subunit GatA, partial [Anaerolineales bacterium]|nr:Asp-tRNA(Asn)/Glu-tRNA(Gln) amidotransferase subunit GatA [Anaerolineales bacterium]
ARLDSLLRAFLTVDADGALAQAEAADREIARRRKDCQQQPWPALLGIPLAVKDMLITKGLRTTAGSRLLENFVPAYDATAVARLRTAGAIILGKTNTDEFAMGSSTENSAYGPTHNPWDLERVPGGSSGGSAAAVAARLAPLALGSDTGGSVRQPAAFCGVTGLKPTYGRVSRYGLVAYASSMDVVGILGQNAGDLIPVFQQIAGHDPLDATSATHPLPTLDRVPADLSSVRLGVPREYFETGLQPEIATAIQAALDQFASLGLQIEAVSLPHIHQALASYYLIAPAEASANLARFDGLRYGQRISAPQLEDVYRQTRGRLFGSEVKRRIMLGTYALSAGYYEAFYGQAQRVRTLIQRDFEAAFSLVDLIAAPVTPSAAFLIGTHQDDPLAMYLEDVFTLPANLAGIPALAFPVGLNAQGLPLGMQLMASHFNEAALFQAVAAYQANTDWHQQAPALLV